jgi:drug/metabolite transporter (DMT)-like permease
MRVHFIKPRQHLITCHSQNKSLKRLCKPFLHIPENLQYRLLSIRCNASEEKGSESIINSPIAARPSPPQAPEPQQQGNTFLIGNAYLLVVSILWGSYTPALKAIFNLPGAPSPLVVAASRGLLQALLLGAAVAIGTGLGSSKNTKDDLQKDSIINEELDDRTNKPLLLDSTSPPPPSSSSAATEDSTPMWLGLSPVVAGAIEIGMYNTIGTLLQTWGLSLSSATRAAFLVQATALWTPILAAAFGMAPSPLLWVSSFIALISTLLVTFDQIDGFSMAAVASGSFSFKDFFAGASLGDAGTLGAALAYSLSTVRIPLYASRVAPLKLAFGKSIALAVTTSTALLIGLLTSGAGGGSGGEAVFSAASLASFWPGCCDQKMAFYLIAWSAVGPGALSAYLHVKGQSLVGPTDAQVVFSAVPLWSAVIAAIVLPGETVGPLAWVGGGGLLLAGLVAALDRTGLGKRNTNGSDEDINSG